MAADGTKVIILSQKHKIEGFIDLLPGARLTDYMNNSNKFIAVTDAMIFDEDNNEIMKAQFINVLVNDIKVILPADRLV